MGGGQTTLLPPLDQIIGGQLPPPRPPITMYLSDLTHMFEGRTPCIRYQFLNLIKHFHFIG